MTVQFGDLLRRARDKKRWRQSDLAKAMKVSQQTVSRWEGGEVPGLNVLAALSVTLDIPLKRLTVYTSRGSGKPHSLTQRVRELELLSETFSAQVKELKGLLESIRGADALR